MSITKEELKAMQEWPLETKIEVTQDRIWDWYQFHLGKVAISFSGGQDSTVLLDIARRIIPDIPAVFVDTGLEYPEIRSFVKTKENVHWITPAMKFPQVIQTFGYPVISKDVSKRIYYARKGSNWAIQHLQGKNAKGERDEYNQRYIKYAHLVDAPFLISSKCCDEIKLKPLAKFHRETGLFPIVGTMACESMRRKSAYMKTGCNAFRSGTSKPLSFWTEQDIMQYIQRFQITYSSVYGDIVSNEKGKLQTTGESRTGCMFCMFGVHMEKKTNRFQRMALTHPKQYDYCINKLGCGPVLSYLNMPY